MRRWWWVVLIGLYLASHLYALTELPVFADEAIYIRWSQLIIDEPVRYAFFPFNDGKTPLYIWSMVPALSFFEDPLFAGRMVSVLVGVAQLVVLWRILTLLKVRTISKIVAGLWVILLPFWFFHHRMALIDAMLTLWLSIVSLSQLQLLSAIRAKSKQMILMQSAVLALAVWLALFTKIPAVLALPSVALGLGLARTKDELRQFCISLVLAGAAALLGFVALSAHPAFPQLFSRGSDFLYPVSEVLSGAWKITLAQIPVYLGYFISYAGPLVLFFAVAGLFSQRQQRQAHWFFWSAILFALPIAVLGKVVYPRYLFPVMWYLTIAAALGLDYLVWQYAHMKRSAVMYLYGAGLAVLIANSILHGVGFVTASLTDYEQVPFVAPDVVQYQHAWSNGRGIKEVTEALLASSTTHFTALATEGFFGTLPDGVLMYLHNQPVETIYVEGIGQPISEVPEYFSERAQEFEIVWLLVNSNRNLLQLNTDQKLESWCTPDETRCLELWDITDSVLPD